MNTQSKTQKRGLRDIRDSFKDHESLKLIGYICHKANSIYSRFHVTYLTGNTDDINRNIVCLCVFLL